MSDTGAGIGGAIVDAVDQDEWDALGNERPQVFPGGIDDSSPYQPPPRQVIIDGERQEWTGPGVVNSFDEFEFYDEFGNPGSYNLRNDPLQLYLSLPQEELDGLLGLMENVGYRVDTRAQQLSAIEELMEASNVIGRTYEVTLRELGMKAPAMSKPAPRYRVSAPGDILAVGNEVAKKTLGRTFTEEEEQRFVNSYQQAELGYQQAGSGVVTDLPRADVAAQQFAEQAAPTEAQAYKYLGAVDMLMRNIGEI